MSFHCKVWNLKQAPHKVTHIWPNQRV